MNAPSGTEQRMTFRLLSYWNRIKGARAFPALTDINISEISDMWHLTFTIDCTGDASRHKFHYFGPELVTAFETNYTGELLQTALQDVMVNNTIGFYEKVIATRAPVSESSSFFDDGKEVRYRSLIVPLSSDGAAIDYLFGTTNYKIF